MQVGIILPAAAIGLGGHVGVIVVEGDQGADQGAEREEGEKEGCHAGNFASTMPAPQVRGGGVGPQRFAQFAGERSAE